jgi:hypothetical protein
MKNKKKSKFGANVVADATRRSNEGSSYGYLNLPKGLTIFKESEGKVFLDIIPYVVTDTKHMDHNPDVPGVAEKGEPWYKKPIMVHRNIGVDNESVICLKTIGKKCPICEERESLLKNGAEWDAPEVKSLKPQLRNLYLVIPIDHKKFDEELHLWDISNGNFQKQLDEELEENPENGVFPDLTEGMTLKIRFNEETFAKSKYYESGRIDFEERDDAYEEDMIDDSPNLDDIINILSYDELQAKFLALDDDDIQESNDDDQQDDESKRTLRKKKRIGPKDESEVEKEKEGSDEKPEKTKKEKSSGKKRKKKSKVKNECPEGHEFGPDWDEYDDCDDCALMDACGDANEAE